MCSQNALGVIHYITPQKFFPSLLYFFVPRAVLNRNLLCDAVLTNENWHIQLLKFIAGVPESFTWWREEHRSPSFYCMMGGSGRRHWGWALWSFCGPEPLTTTTTTLSAVRSVIRGRSVVTQHSAAGPVSTASKPALIIYLIKVNLFLFHGIIIALYTIPATIDYLSAFNSHTHSSLA